jgi:SSS family solute:Na+ symporter
MAGNFWRAALSWLVCFVATILISFFTKPKPESELKGLVWGMPSADEAAVAEPWYKRPVVLGVIVLLLTLACNFIFW